MASPSSFIFAIYDGTTGAPKTGLTPTFDVYCTDLAGALSQPAIVELGGGLYKFDPPSFITGRGIAFCVNTTGNLPARVVGYLRPDDFIVTASASPNLIVFPIFDSSTGALKTGVTPTFTTYVDDTGATLASPSITEIGTTGIYRFKPVPPTNRDVAYVLNTAGNLPLNVSGFVRAEDFPQTSTTTLVGPSITSASALTTTVDYGIDTYCVTDLPLISVPVSGAQLVAQRVLRRLQTPRGALAAIGGSADYGFAVQQLVNAKIGPADIARFQAQIAAEVQKDEAVEQAAVTITYGGSSSTLSITISLVLADGPFTLVIGVDALTVSLLSLS